MKMEPTKQFLAKPSPYATEKVVLETHRTDEGEMSPQFNAADARGEQGEEEKKTSTAATQ